MGDFTVQFSDNRNTSHSTCRIFKISAHVSNKQFCISF